jgi:hypothetical protein
MAWLTTLIELAGIVLAYLVGRKQGRDNERTYQLSVRQATPRIGTRMEFVGLPTQNIANQLRYSIQTTIYNDGGLVASNLQGNWKLTSSYEFLNASEIVRADSLPASLPIKLNHDLGYHREDVWSKPEVVLKVDLHLTYLGFADKEENYQVTYQYDPKSGKMIQAIQ